MNAIKKKLTHAKSFTTLLLFVLCIGLQSPVYAQLNIRNATPAESAALTAGVTLSLNQVQINAAQAGYITEKITKKQGINNDEYKILMYHVMPAPTPVAVPVTDLLSHWEVCFSNESPHHNLIWRNQFGNPIVTANSGVAGGLGGAVGGLEVAAPGAANTKYLYVMDLNGRMYIHQEIKNPLGQANLKFGHPSFLGGAPVAGAGEISVHNGVIQWISNVSGHYRPTLTATHKILARLAIMRASSANYNGLVANNLQEGIRVITLTVAQEQSARVFLNSFVKHLVSNDLVTY